MKMLLRISIVVGLLTISAFRVQACSCAEPSQREKFRKADLVFVGEVTERSPFASISKDSFFIETVTFTVQRQWKGSKQNQIRLLLPFDNPGMCGGLRLKLGSQYLMYAYREKEGLVSYTDCGPNILASDAGADIKNLNRFWFRLSARLWLFN
jgi:hypothetical protein